MRAHRPALDVDVVFDEPLNGVGGRANRPRSPAPQDQRFAEPGAGARRLAGGGLFKIVQAPLDQQQTWAVLLSIPERPFISTTKRCGVVAGQPALTPLKPGGSGADTSSFPWGGLRSGRLPIARHRSRSGNSSPVSAAAAQSDGQVLAVCSGQLEPRRERNSSSMPPARFRAQEARRPWRGLTDPPHAAAPAAGPGPCLGHGGVAAATSTWLDRLGPAARSPPGRGGERLPDQPPAGAGPGSRSRPSFRPPNQPTGCRLWPFRATGSRASR